MAGRTEGTVRDVVGETSGVDRCPAPEASPVLQSEEGDCIILFEVDENIGQVYVLQERYREEKFARTFQCSTNKFASCISNGSLARNFSAVDDKAWPRTRACGMNRKTVFYRCGLLPPFPWLHLPHSPPPVTEYRETTD